MEKYNLVKKCGREFSDAFTLLCDPLPIFKFLTEIHMKTLPLVIPLSKYWEEFGFSISNCQILITVLLVYCDHNIRPRLAAAASGE